MGTRRPPAARLLAAVLAALALFLVSAGLSSAATSQQDLAQAKAKLAELNTRLDALVISFQIDAVLRSQLLLETGRQRQSINIIVRSLALVHEVIRIQRVAEFAQGAVLRTGLLPVAAAEICGAGKNST